MEFILLCSAEYLARDKANIDWLKASFELAKQQNRRGLVLVFQADPGFDLPETERIDESLGENFSAYRNFMNQVIKETEQFHGQVLLVHGDTHFFKMDKPLYSPTKMLTNLTDYRLLAVHHFIGLKWWWIRVQRLFLLCNLLS